MGCNCRSNLAKEIRNQLAQKPVSVPGKKTPVRSGSGNRLNQDKTICPVCKGELIYRLEHVRNDWVKVLWCNRCNVRYKH